MKNYKLIKKVVKAAENLAYIIGGIGSIALFNKAVEIAEAERGMYALGGELFVPIVVYAIIYILVKWGSRKATEHICLLEEKAANDPFKHKGTVAVASLLPNGSCKVRSRDGSVVCYSSFGEYLKNM